jgi:hypothetical protein
MEAIMTDFYSRIPDSKPWEYVDGGPCPRCSRPMGTWWRDEDREYWVEPGGRMGNKSHGNDTPIELECPDCGHREPERGDEWTDCPVCSRSHLRGHPCRRCGYIPEARRRNWQQPGDIPVCRCGAAAGILWQFPDDLEVVFTWPGQAGHWARRIGQMCPYCGRTEVVAVFGPFDG